MKKLAFVLGYAGGILALVFSLVMIYIVPLNFISKAIEDTKYEMKNENIIALNEVLWSMRTEPAYDYSESGLIEYALDVAKESELIHNESVYEDAVVFMYKTALRGIISMALVGISIIFALIAFIGALICRKASNGGAVLMLVSSLVLLLSAIYTGTVLPMIIASVLLAAAGIVSFIPAYQQTPIVHARNREKPHIDYNHQYRQPYPQQPYAPYQQQYAQSPQQNSQPYQQPYLQQNQQNQTVEPVQAPARQIDVPFPEVETQVFTQPVNSDDVK